MKEYATHTQTQTVANIRKRRSSDKMTIERMTKPPVLGIGRMSEVDEQISRDGEYWSYSLELQHQSDPRYVDYKGKLWGKGDYESIAFNVEIHIDDEYDRVTIKDADNHQNNAGASVHNISRHINTAVQRVIDDFTGKVFKSIHKHVGLLKSMPKEIEKARLEKRLAKERENKEVPFNPAINTFHAYNLCAKAQKANGRLGLTKKAIFDIIKMDPTRMLKEYQHKIRIVGASDGDIYIFDTEGTQRWPTEE